MARPHDRRWLAWFGAALIAACGLTHESRQRDGEPRDRAGAGRGAEPAVAIDRSACVTHWVTSGIGAVPELYESSAQGPRSPQALFPRPNGGDRGYVVQTSTDFTGDGVRDLAVRDWYPGSAAVCEKIAVTVHAAGAGPVSEWLQTSAASADCEGPYASLGPLGDWNGDGSDDLVAQGFVFVRGSDGAPIEASQRCRRGGRLGDVDGDGRTDSACAEGSPASGDLIAVTSGEPDAPYTELLLTAADGSPGDGQINAITAAGDLDADGYDDFIVHDFSEGHRLVFGAPRPELGARVLLVIGTGAVFAIAPGDVDGDGRDDLVLSTADMVRFVRGQAGFAQETLVRGQTLSMAVSDRVSPAGDANCDGFADLLIRKQSSYALHLGSRSGISERAEWSFEARALDPVFANEPEAR
jgi:hypothetical protein